MNFTVAKRLGFVFNVTLDQPRSQGLSSYRPIERAKRDGSEGSLLARYRGR